MRTTILIIATVLLGAVISGTLAGGGRGNKRLWLLNALLSALMTFCAFLCLLGIYANAAGLPCSFARLFPEWLSKLMGCYCYLLTSAAAGIVLGALESQGLRRFARRAYQSRHFAAAVAGFLAVTAVFAGAGIGITYASKAQTLRISEVCPHNFNLAMDEDGNFSDYIELYNEGDSPVDLSDFYLSDDKDNPARFQLPNMELEAGAYILIWADGTGEVLEESGEIHANFRLSDGEVVTLTTKTGTTVDAVELGNLPDNVAATLIGNRYVEAYGTPGQANEDCRLYQAATLTMPGFSLESGFYPEESITLEITAPKGATVYYTTDGSTPDTTSQVYTGPLTLRDVSSEPNRYVNVVNTVANYDTHEVNNDPVNKASVIRAIAIDGDGNFSEIVTATYFVGEAAEAYEGYAVLSIVSDPEGLFGGNGICVTGSEYDEWYNNTDRSTAAPTTNFNQHGRLWEREAAIQLWNADGELVLDQDCGIRVQGTTWRTYAIKRFSFYAREYYSGSDTFDAAIFSSEVATHSFYTRSDDADMIAQELVKDRELSTQDGIPAVCFLDGEFYCVTYLRERHDSTYFAQHYGVAEEDVVVVTGGELDEGTEEDLAEYNALIQFLTEADTTDPQVYAEIESKLDIQSFIDFMAATMYSNNIDVSTQKNFKMWRIRSEGGEGYYDGKWRMAIYDMDAVSWGYFVRTDSGVADLDPFKWTLDDAEKYGEVPMLYIRIPFFKNLLRNEAFRQQFILTYLDMMNVNFSMDSYGGMELEAYKGIQEGVWTALLTERHAYAVEHLKYAFDLTGEACEVTLETGEGGTIQINTTQAISKDGMWTGTYLSGMEITLTARAEDGWEFAGWEGDIHSGEESLTAQLTDAGITLKAVFVRSGGGS